MVSGVVEPREAGGATARFLRCLWDMRQAGTRHRRQSPRRVRRPKAMSIQPRLDVLIRAPQSPNQRSQRLNAEVPLSSSTPRAEKPSNMPTRWEGDGPSSPRAQAGYQGHWRFEERGSRSHRSKNGEMTSRRAIHEAKEVVGGYAIVETTRKSKRARSRMSHGDHRIHGAGVSSGGVGGDGGLGAFGCVPSLSGYQGGGPALPADDCAFS